MFNLLGFTLDEAKTILDKENVKFFVREYHSRFRGDVVTDSVRIVRQRETENNGIELVVSDFKTISQSQ